MNQKNKNTLLIASILIGITGVSIGGSATILTATHHHQEQVGQAAVKTTKTNLPQQAIPEESTARYSIVMVYKDGCQYCKSARETITKEMHKNADTVTQFTQIQYQTPFGQKLLHRFNAKGVPLIILIDNTTNKVHSVDDSEVLGIKYLMENFMYNK